MYEVGALILYGRTGVCRVDAISKSANHSETDAQEYYVLRPLFQNCSITIPVGSTKVFTRPVISCSEAQALIRKMPDIAAEPYYNRNLNQLREHYRTYMESHSCEDLVTLTKSLHLKKKESEAQNKKFGAVDERFLKEAEDLLFGELAAALDIARDEVQNYIANCMCEI